VAILLVPFVSAFLNHYMHYLLQHDTSNVYRCLMVTCMYNYCTYVVQQSLMFRQSQLLKEKFMHYFHTSHLECGVPLPGLNRKRYNDLRDDSFKLRDFLAVLPILWSTIVNFGVTIYMMKTPDNSDIPLRFLFTVGCIGLCTILTYITDQSVYEKTKPPPGTIVTYKDKNETTMKVGLNYTTDPSFEERKRKQMDKQHAYSTYVIILINVITTYIALTNNAIEQLHSFSNISWMIGCLSYNLKSLQYYSYMDEFITFMKCMKEHRLECMKEHRLECMKEHRLECNGTTFTATKITFHNATFGYYTGDILAGSTYKPVIHNLNFTFNRSRLYYLEATNGIGKSTLLNMFTSNLHEGTITFDNINRSEMSFWDLHTKVIRGYQSSEYSPSFTKDDTSIVKGKDPWLEKQLVLTDLFDKDFVEMSGGQKKRMLIYMLLTSSALVILLDEILSELSTEDAPEVPEGGGWLTRVMNTLVEWPGRENKLIILVGHGLRELMPKSKSIIYLRLEQTNDGTVLSKN
jgi:ABC-type cobalamin/Fe3+-siderophores transport system ATPase subunit